MIDNVNKISIIGGPGTGKTTLAENLGKELNLPIHHLDGKNYLENWIQRDTKERDNMILEIANKDKWIMDGTYRSTLEQRIEKSEMVIFLNYSTLAKVKGIITRTIKQGGKERPEIPGCKEKIDLEFIKLTMKWNKTKRKFIKEILEKNSDKEIITFNRRSKLNKWYKDEFNKGIEL